MSGLWGLAPEFIALLGALVALFADAIVRDGRAAARAGALAAAVAALVAVVIGPGAELFGGMLVL
ncbi:MAG: hypothetical protein WBJ62_06545, partial [Coriobacteriia bacterium]